MAKTDDELRELAKQPGWRLDTGEGAGHSGTLGDVAKVAHARRARGEPPGIVRRIENAVELEMLEVEQLWRAIGLPI
ncbi:MAG: hypothetical protein ACREHV_04265 [Rhizomicrobium sp.]